MDDVDARRVLPRAPRVGWTKPNLAELPSHYLRRQVHATFQNDPVAIHNIPFTGTDCLLWGNDFPHPESTYPDSNKVLDALLRASTDADAAGSGVRQRPAPLRVRRERPRTRGLTCPRSATRHSTTKRSPSPRASVTSRSRVPSRRHATHAEHRTTLLIDAALDLVAERGSLEFTVQEVVARAQLSLHALLPALRRQGRPDRGGARGVARARRARTPRTGRGGDRTDRSPPRVRHRVLRARDVEWSTHARLRSHVPDARAPPLRRRAREVVEDVSTAPRARLRAVARGRGRARGPLGSRHRPPRRLHPVVGVGGDRARHRRTGATLARRRAALATGRAGCHRNRPSAITVEE